jgi:NADH dehydrogenase
VNICVLGGTGFVGTELVTRLALDGHWVRVPTRNPARAQRLRVLDTVELRTANVHHAGTLSQLFEGCEAAVNLVGILNPGGGASFRRVHTELPAKVLAAARAAGVRHLLHMSALGADERGPSQYLRTKGAAETQLRAPAAPGPAAPTAVTIFRPSVIYGAGDSLTNRFARLLRLTAGILPLARAGARFAPIYVRDVVQAFTRALHERRSFGETYELCGPDVMTLAGIVRLTARSAGLACHIVPLPDLLARAQGVVMGALPGKPFSLDNFRSLTIDCVCREDGCARLGIEPRRMSAVLPTYLGSDDLETQLAQLRKTADR